jgi:hypothetical protein
LGEGTLTLDYIFETELVVVTKYHTQP